MQFPRHTSAIMFKLAKNFGASFEYFQNIETVNIICLQCILAIYFLFNST